ncbi:hypothetical protein [Imhoffiella purpurea]|uniref:Uncharacterized protein n=1 Tax=Imhoffiella purpurea TaxID=1249627 RepID=W9V2N1_9GAMM|nr:hypothetical protein [Imhoffiella purpurea]EXJ13589.1 hypothetical protein D779_3592 [Imhoffiella purpurea]
MYLEDPEDINTLDDDDRPVDTFEDWAMSLDAWLDTPAGLAWLDAQAEACSMGRDAELYGIRPGLGVRRHG